MNNQKKINELTEYWVKSSKEDLKTMQALYESGRYAFCLFIGHLVLEKALKAVIVSKTKEQAPRTHNLPYLAEVAKLEMSENEASLLREADTFNMEARYPDEKLIFTKKCTKAYTNRYYEPIISLYKKLCQKAKSKK
jgi:HEPN domain-containing protein